jgi:TatD DNase family protein
MLLIDSHTHLYDDKFDVDREEVLARADSASVRKFVAIGAGMEESRAAVALAERDERVVATVGVHPHEAKTLDEAAWEELRRLGAHPRVRAIGEIGLDYHYDFSPPDVQQAVFAAQVRLARELALPVIIHTREATPDTFRMLREEGAGQVRGVFHCFTGDAAMAVEAVALGFHVSFAGIVTFPRAGALREAAAVVPADRLLAETDAPYLAPVPWRGKRNEPAHVSRVYETLAEVRGEGLDALRGRIADNFVALFGCSLTAGPPGVGGK